MSAEYPESIKNSGEIKRTKMWIRIITIGLATPT
jgi:hypothetical protein